MNYLSLSKLILLSCFVLLFSAHSLSQNITEITFRDCNFQNNCNAFAGNPVPCQPYLIDNTHGSPSPWILPGDPDEREFVLLEAYTETVNENGQQVSRDFSEGFGIGYDFKRGADYTITITTVQPTNYGQGRYIVALANTLPPGGSSSCAAGQEPDFTSSAYANDELGAARPRTNNSDATFSRTGLSANYNTLWIRSEAITSGIDQATATVIWSIRIEETELPTLNAPGNLVANATFANQVVLSWQDTNSGELRYQVERRVNGGAWEFFRSQPANSTGLTDNTALPGNTYEYRVSAEDDFQVPTPVTAAASTPSVTNWLTSPNGGEEFERLTSFTITWDANLVNAEDLLITLFDNGSVDQFLAAQTPNDGSFTFAIPDGFKLSDNYRIRLTIYDKVGVWDFSNQDFAIIDVQHISQWLIEPEFLGTIAIKDTLEIKWRLRKLINNEQNVIIDLTKNETLIYRNVVPHNGNLSIYLDPIHFGPMKDCHIIIRDPNDLSKFDKTPQPFEIIESVDFSNWIVAPNGGEKIDRGETINISINPLNFHNEVISIDLYKAGNYYGRIGAWNLFSNWHDLSYPLTIPNNLPIGNDYTIRIHSGSFEDFSDNPFSIVNDGSPDLMNWVTSPNGGESYVAGDPLNIAYHHFTQFLMVYFQLYKGGELVLDLSNQPVMNTGVSTIQLPGTLEPGSYRIKIVNAGDPSTFDWSDGIFSIQAPNRIGQPLEESVSELIKVYPTAIDTYLQIIVPEELTQEKPLFKAINLYGQVVLEQLINELNSQVDLSSLNAGIYLINIETSGGNYQQKVIKN